MFQVEVAKLNRADLESYLRPILAQSTDPVKLREILEETANANGHFPGLVCLWGPDVYRRNRVIFRPLIVARFSFFYWEGKKIRRSPWTAEMDAWLAEVEANQDNALARLLIQWKLSATRGTVFWPEAPVWRNELLRRFKAAANRPARAAELDKMAFQWGGLDEPTAIQLYEIDARTSRKFILQWAPAHSYYGKPAFWEKLIERAKAAGDEPFALDLYRYQVSAKMWTEDALALCRRVQDPARLLEELEKIHPKRANELGKGMVALLEARGRDVVPFVMRHMRNVMTGWMSRGEFGRVAAIATANQWWDLWACSIRVCATTKEFNEELSRLLANRSLDEVTVRERLEMLSGVAREWNFSGFGLATVHDLTEENALALHERFPALLRGPFRTHLQGRYSGTHRRRLIERLIAGGEADHDLLDFLASRFATNRGWPNKKMAPEVEQFAGYYSAMRDTGPFARRAAAVLGQIPAFAIQDYDGLMRENRLARLLFVRSLSIYLDDERAIADLVEGSEIHVMATAYRILALDDLRARRLAAHHLPLLLGTLLRPMQRVTRAAAFGALFNASLESEDAARAVLDRARQALVLPDKKYPKEELVGLIGKILHRWPGLRSPNETRVIFRRKPAA